MKIKKMYQGTVPENKILNTQSDSQTDVYSCDYINKLNTYSTEEQVIGTWIDGKTLYKRTFTGITVNGEYTTLTTDYNSNTIKVTKVYGGIHGDYGTQVGCYINNNYYSGVFTHIDELQLYYGGFLKGKEYNVTIEFTKTTD